MNQRNTKGQKHGLWEDYHDNGKLSWKGTYLNDKRHGFWEDYYPDGQLRDKEFHL